MATRRPQVVVSGEGDKSVERRSAIAFDAAMVRATEERWGTLVIFSVDETLEAGLYLMIQGKQSFSERDIRFGIDNVYVETCGQGWSWYGHIESFQLHRDRVIVQLDHEAATHMGNSGAVAVAFQLSSERFSELRSSLQRVFAGRAYFVDAATG